MEGADAWSMKIEAESINLFHHILCELRNGSRLPGKTSEITAEFADCMGRSKELSHV